MIEKKMSMEDYEINVMRMNGLMAEIEERYGVISAFSFFNSYIGIVLLKAQKEPTVPEEELIFISGLTTALNKCGYNIIKTTGEPVTPYTDNMYPTAAVMEELGDNLTKNQPVLDMMGLKHEDVLNDGLEIIKAGNLIVEAYNSIEPGHSPAPTIVGFQTGICKVLEKGLEQSYSYGEAQFILDYSIKLLNELKTKYR